MIFLYDHLLTLEKNFFQLDYISDPQWLDSILHTDFLECGKSGLLYDKAETIHALLTYRENRTIAIYNFECNALSSNCWMVHYITKDQAENLVYRTSIWLKEEHFQLRFHQASILNTEISLIEC